HIENWMGLQTVQEVDMALYTGIQRLTITNCNLRTIQTRAFAQNPHLHYINLSKNPLTTLSWQLFQNLQLIDLRLEGVVFNCSCEIRWIQLWQQRGEASLHNQQLFCNTGFSQIPLQLLNISHCDVPEISVTNSSLTVTEGDQVTITCNGSGVPVPDVDWKVNSLHSISTQQATQFPPHVHSLTLTLFNVSRDDNLSLLPCTTENIVGMSNTSVHLSVQFPPTIIRFEKPEKWHDTCMMFIVRGQPLPEVNFLYKDSQLPQTTYINMAADVYRDSLEGCLIFKNPTHHNNGNYTLQARNTLGVATKTVDAHFMGAPFD
ncbi:NT-3 growth factor receptor-like, partial [Clarias magur]